MSALHVRLTLAFAGLLALVGLGLLALVSRTSDRYSDEVRQRLDSGISMYVVRELALIEEGHVNAAALRELGNRAMTVNPSAEVYLLDRDGKVLSTVVQRDRVVRKSVRLAPIEEFLRAPDKRPIYGDDPSSADGQRVFSVAPIQEHGRLEGYLYVVLGGQPERSIAEHVWGSYALRAAALSLGLLILATLAVAGGLFTVLTRRLRALDRTLDTWSRTLPAEALPRRCTTTGDEISALTARFADMSRAIEHQIEELKATDKLRRELIANVSHDLRTPLATLRGYIETLLVKSSGASAADLSSHLRIALRQADQLGKLIDALFELARLESGTVAPAVEPTAIAELLQDVAIRFRIAAEQRGVELRTLLDTRGVFVLADAGMIERVMSNLLENALRHTPRGGQARIEMGVEAALVRVRVVDTGEGIATENLPRILDRHFSLRDSKDGSRAGLGLAIVQRIMSLHGQTVSVLSQRGVGTTIEITLTRAGEPMLPVEAKSA
jgi:two-component system, OmpR family, sensor kinase